MNPDDQLLTGRTEAEEQGLVSTRKAVDRAKREFEQAAGGPSASARSAAGQTARALRKLEQLLGVWLAVEEVERAHQAKLEELADSRRDLLPADAEDFRVVPDENEYDDRRYTVQCKTTHGVNLSLGGCSNIGLAQAREEWFREALASRSKPSP